MNLILSYSSLTNSFSSILSSISSTIVDLEPARGVSGFFVMAFLLSFYPCKFCKFSACFSSNCDFSKSFSLLKKESLRILAVIKKRIGLRKFLTMLWSFPKGLNPIMLRYSEKYWKIYQSGKRFSKPYSPRNLGSLMKK